jgi:hypothetical protein
MALTRLYEEHEITPDLRRIYSEVRTALDLPFVPSLFKVCAGNPEFLKLIWKDLKPVAASREFQAAAGALEEYTRAFALRAGWRFSDQERVLTGQRFSVSDVEQMGAIVGVFTRALPAIALFARLLQRGYSGGQGGHISSGRQVSALARLVTLHVPSEKDSGLRVWLLYHDIKRTTGSSNVMSFLRLLSPFPGYLASVWLDCKRLLSEPSFQRAREEVNTRTLALISGLPVRDHRAEAKGIHSGHWKEIEEAVDGFARQLPQFALLVAAWQRAFPFAAHFLAA